MCGIVGVSGNLFAKDVKTFNDMLIANSVRGKESTGVVGFNHGASEGHMLKRVGHPYDLMESKYYDTCVSASKYVIIGHGRMPTMGRVCNANAHPFSCHNIVGVHNGSLRGAWRTKLKDSSKYDTDSEALLQAIDEFGAAEVMTQIEGAWALVWYDVRDKTIHFLRNDERPLFYGVTDDGKQLFWASEALNLRWAANRNDVKIDKIFQVLEDTHYVWKQPAHNQPFEAPKRSKIERYVPPVSQYVGGFRGSSMERGGSSSSVGHPVLPGLGGPTVRASVKVENLDDHRRQRGDRFPHEATTAKAGQTAEKRTADIASIWENPNWKPPYKDKDGKVINKILFNRYVSDGCCWCTQNDSVWGDRVCFMGKDDTGKMAYMCETCLMDEETRNIMGIR